MYLFADGARASYRARRTIESSEQSVTRGVHLAAAKSGQLFSYYHVPVAEQLAPSRITQLGCALGRADDIGEHYGGQHAIGMVWVPLAGNEFLDLVRDEVLCINIDDGMVGARHLDQLRIGNVLGEIAAAFERD